MGDYLVRILAKEAGLRGFICITTDLSLEAAARHQTSATAAVVLGRGLTGAALMAALLKVQQRVALKFEGSGPIDRLLVEGDSYGRVRGYLAPPTIELPRQNGNVDIIKAIGQAGLMTVVKDLRVKKLYESVVPLAVSDISGDLHDYFLQSEQIPTLVQIGEVLDQENHIACAGGLLIQELPGNQENRLPQLQERLQELPPVADLLNSSLTVAEVADTIFAGIPFEVVEERALRFQCDCSRERTRAALVSLGHKEVAELLEKEGQAVLNCHYCHEEYLFNEFDLEVILMEIGD